MKRIPLLAVVLLALSCSAEEDWATCSPCRCSWVSGRKNADCKWTPSTTLNSIPMNLSSEIRSVDFSDQPLYELQKNAFASVNLGDLQKIKLVNCRLSVIDKAAFSHMQLLIELDMSKNDVSKFDAETFKDNKRLRVLRLNDNKLERLEDGLFSNLTYLQSVELNNNRIAYIGKYVFFNTPKLLNIMLNSNLLKYMDASIIQNLEKLSSLSLHNNSWVCDCHLKTFRDLTVEHNNWFTLPTECAYPERLKGRSWSELSSEDFACRPRIIDPPNSSKSIEAEFGNVTLSCKVKGNPRPDVNWVFKNAIIDSNPRRPGGHRYSQTSSIIGDDTYWFNLTIVNVNYQDGGEYKCAAKNPGGIQERNITLKVTYLPSPASGIALADTWTLVLFIILGLVILALLLTVLLWCCLRKSRNGRHHAKGNAMSPNGDISLEGTCTEMEKSLICAVNPVEKPPRQYPPSVASGVTEVSEVQKTLLDNDSIFAAGDDDSRFSDFVEPTPRKSSNLLDVEHIRSDRPYPPDLLSFPARGMQISPAGSSASTVPDHSRLQSHGAQSPVHSPLFDTPGIYRTLPYSRSHSPFTSPHGAAPVIIPRSANKGYVTMPRRNRVPSWSSAPPSSPLIAEPVYDNLGLRTTAEGSSMLSLNKAGNGEAVATPRPRPIVSPVGVGGYPASGMGSIPIEEFEVHQLNGRSNQIMSPGLENMVGKRDSWTRMNPEATPQPKHDVDARRLSSASLASVPEGRKIAPRPPPKPKKSVSTGPLFEDEGEDGTEV